MKHHHFESDFPVRGIDVKNGIVHGATICVSGIEAKGHGLKTDQTLLRQLLISAQKKGVIGVGIDHKSGVKGTAGAAQNFRIEGDKLVADIEFFKTHADFPLLMDQLSTLGNTMGISASFVGDADGDKARCKELLACDVVCHPAAAPTGLFSRRDFDALNENSDQNESDESMNEDQIAELLHELLDHVEHLEAENEQLQEALEALQDDDEDAEDQDDANDDQDAVLEESGARGGPHQYGALNLKTFDFESAIEENRRAGMDPKKAFIEAHKSFARQKYQMLNL